MPVDPHTAPLIIHVVRQYAPSRGGLEDVVANLATESTRAGYRVKVVTLDRLFKGPERRLAKHETINGIEVERIAWSGSSRYPIAPSILKAIRPADLVHVHGIDFFFDFLAVTRPYHRKKLVITTHGGFFHTQKFALIKKVWFQTLTRLSLSAYEGVVACSRSDQALFETVSRAPVTLIENGVDTSKFRDIAASKPGKRIISIGRFSFNKRLDRLITAMSALVKRDSDWHLDIVGVGADQSVADLEGLIDRLDLARHVTVHDNLETPAVRDLIKEATYFASASEYEGFGLVAIEAMSAGLVPVLAENSAYRALSNKHPDVTVVDYDLPDAVANAFLAKAALPDAALGTLRACLLEAAAGYAWPRVAQDYLALYRRILDR